MDDLKKISGIVEIKEVSGHGRHIVLFHPEPGQGLHTYFFEKESPVDAYEAAERFGMAKRDANRIWRLISPAHISFDILQSEFKPFIPQ